MDGSNDPVRDMMKKSREMARHIAVAKKLVDTLVSELSLSQELVPKLYADIANVSDDVTDFTKLGRLQNPTHSYSAYIEKALERGEGRRKFPQEFMRFYAEFLLRFSEELHK